MAQRPSAVGVVVFSMQARVGASPISAGSSVYSGEQLRTGKEGSLRVRVGSVQLSLGPLSLARVFLFDQRTVVFLRAGSLTYSAHVLREPLTIRAGTARFSPAVSQRSLGQIELEPPCGITTRVFQGTLEVDSGSQTQIVRAGEEYLVSAALGVASEPPSQSGSSDPSSGDSELDSPSQSPRGQVSCGGQNSSPNPPSRMKLPWPKIALTGGIAATVGIALYKSMESPDRP